jgi:hypothetical protein
MATGQLLGGGGSGKNRRQGAPSLHPNECANSERQAHILKPQTCWHSFFAPKWFKYEVDTRNSQEEYNKSTATLELHTVGPIGQLALNKLVLLG